MLAETFPNTSEICMSEWGLRLSLCAMLFSLFLLPQLLPTCLVKPHSDTSSTCLLPLLCILHAYLPPLLFLSLPSHSSPPCPTSHNTPTLVMPPAPPSAGRLCGQAENKQTRAAWWNCSDLDQSKCFSGLQFPPCKMQMIFNASAKYFKVFWWKRSCNTQASDIIRPSPLRELSLL